jgi:Helix-turn-helix domain
MKELLTEREAAKVLHLSTKSLQGWRYRGGGPRFVKLGRSVRYAMSDLESFVLAALRTSTSDPGRSPVLLSRPSNCVTFLDETPDQTRARVRAAAALPPAKAR